MTELKNDLLSKVAAIEARIKAQQEELKEASKVAFEEGTKEIFEVYPFLAQIEFTAYTPYFNDGDPCEYHLGEITMSSEDDVRNDTTNGPWENGTEFEKKSSPNLWDRYNRETKQYDPNPDLTPEYEECRKVVVQLIQAIPESTYMHMFGDHVSITITREGIDVTDYDHD